MSSAFHYLTNLVRDDGLTLLVGTTVLLAMFALLVRYSRSLSTKNLLASTAMLAVLGYLVVAIVPMPRFGIDLRGAENPGTATQTPNGQPELPVTQLTPITGDELMFAALQQANAKQPNDTADASVTPPAMPSRAERMASSLLTPGPTHPAASNAIDLSIWLAGALAIGAMLFALHLLVGWLHLRRLLNKSQHAPSELTGLVELPAGTRLRIVNAAVQPFCFGLLRPTIVLPQKLAQPTDETRFILLHERAHLTSGDTRARLLAALLRPLLFWHPLYWWLQRQLRFTSELLADDAAAEGSVADYVRCMMTLSTHPDPATGGALVATIFQRRSELFRRLEMMLQRNEVISRSHSPLSRWTRAASTLVLIALCAGTFGVEDAVAQSPRKDPVSAQVRVLKAELDRLRREITALRDSEKPTPPKGWHSGRFKQNGEFTPGTAPTVDPAIPSRPLLRNVQFGRLNEQTGEIDPVAGQLAVPSTPTRRGRNSVADPVRAPAAISQNPIATSSAADNRRILYKVQLGDTLEKIAKKYMGSRQGVQEIIRCNPNMKPRMLRIGQQLTIPVRTPRKITSDFGTRLPTKGHGSNQGPAIRHPAGPSTAGPSAPRASRHGSATPPTAASAPRPSRYAQEPAPPGPSAPRARNGRVPTPPGPSAPRAGRSPRASGANAPAASGPSRRGPSTGVSSPRNPVLAGQPSRPTPPSPSAYGNYPSARNGQPATGPTTTKASGLTHPPRAANTTRQAPASSLNGLADLVTRCIELRGDVEIQEVNVRHAQGNREMDIAKIRLRTKMSQWKAIESMVKQELAAAEQAHAHSKKLHERGFITASDLQATESKIVLLSRALK
ncbi:MAG: beta-lactamase regulating signal transducer with metallopeptidase domain/LysM repeat protein [Planctomycetota bacterium]|jgi:beta-lactamase regulating signal transducer with metallopeptidase domain/LysM repeat protein